MSISIQRDRYEGRDYYVGFSLSWKICLAPGMAKILKDFMNRSSWV